MGKFASEANLMVARQQTLILSLMSMQGLELDEPVVQTTDNSTYLDKTFDGGNVPVGTVFMDPQTIREISAIV